MRGAGCNGTVMGFEFWVPCASASVVETNFQRLINRSCACIWVSEFMRNYRRSSARRATSCSRQNMVYGKENHLPPSPPTPNAPSSCRTPVTTSVARSRHETLEDFPSNSRLSNTSPSRPRSGFNPDLQPRITAAVARQQHRATCICY